MKNYDKTLVLLPAYNEGKVISEVVKGLIKSGFGNVLVIDDCSKDNTSDEAYKAGAIVLRHPINRGAGGATNTGLEYARREEDYDYVLMMDSDGQHSIEDAKKLMSEANRYDVVLGSRMINPKGMPSHRLIANRVGSFVTMIFFGLYVTDSQSGMKVFNKKAINKIKITFDRFEKDSEIIGEIYRNKLKFKELPIKVIYTDHSLSKGQNIMNGFKMIIKFIFRT